MQLVFEENYAVHFCPVIAAMESPTVAEINAGIDVTELLTKDGVNPGSSNNKVAAGNLATAFDAEIMGSHGANLSMKYFKDNEDDIAWDLFPRLTSGYYVVSPFGPAIAGAPVYVWKVQTGEPTLPSSAANERQTFTSECAVQKSELYAQVAA
jgi:hypothetical protein